MQAIIMAAGMGSRIKNVSCENPKSFLEIQGIKLIEYNLAMLNEAGIDEIIIVTGYKTTLFEEYLLCYKNVKCVYNPFYDMTNVIGSFFLAQNYLQDDVVYLHADTLCEPAIFNEMLDTNGSMVLPVDYDSINEEAMKARVSGNKIVEISKKIELNNAHGEFIGILKISKSILEDVKKATKLLMEQKQFNEYFEATISKIIEEDKHEIIAIPTSKRFWCEIDFEEDYKKACDEIPCKFVKTAKEYLRQINECK